LIGSSSLQGHSSSSDFPKWAIALIVILGFLALLGALVASYFLVRLARQRRANRMEASGSSLNSGTPMMRDIGGAGSVDHRGSGHSGGGPGKGLEEGLMLGGILGRKSNKESHKEAEDEENVGMMSSDGGHSSRQSSGETGGPISPIGESEFIV
jgi:hypothetical protein